MVNSTLREFYLDLKKKKDTADVGQTAQLQRKGGVPSCRQGSCCALWAYLACDALHQLVHGEADVGVDGEHLTEGVLVLCGVDAAVEQAAHHVQEGWVVFLQLHLT